MITHGIPVKGNVIDEYTRCSHYHSDNDIIAIKFPCCDTYYPCHQCHEETAGHKAELRDPDRFDEKAILCGACGYELTVHEYLNSDSVCPSCNASFNPGCKSHYPLYFHSRK